MKKLFCALALILVIMAAAGCSLPASQTAEKDVYLDIPDESYSLNSDTLTWIYPDDAVDMTNLNVYWQADNLQFPTDENATLTIYVRASKNDNGEFSFDDGQDWLALLETSVGNFSLFPRQFVQLGIVSCTVFKDAEDIFHVLVTVRQTAGYRIYDCQFDQQQNAFKAIPVYEAAGINFITASP